MFIFLLNIAIIVMATTSSGDSGDQQWGQGYDHGGSQVEWSVKTTTAHEHPSKPPEPISSNPYSTDSAPNHVKIVVLGAPGVGKTAIIQASVVAARGRYRNDIPEMLLLSSSLSSSSSCSPISASACMLSPPCAVRRADITFLPRQPRGGEARKSAPFCVRTF